MVGSKNKSSCIILVIFIYQSLYFANAVVDKTEIICIQPKIEIVVNYTFFGEWKILELFTWNAVCWYVRSCPIREDVGRR